MGSPLVAVHRLEKRYGAFAALKGVSFEVGAGEIVGFLGPNGAGKSTTMKILTGFMAPTAGAAQIAGFDVVGESLSVRRALGYLPESAPSYPEMLVADYLDFVGQVRGMAHAERVRAIDRVAGECDIHDRLRQTIGTLSKGYRQRVGLAQALLHQPKVLLLDEPTSGLDPNQIFAIRDLIRRLGSSRTVILSTHILQEVQATCDRVIIVNQGQIVADAPTAEIQAHQAGGALFKVSLAAGSVRLGADALLAGLAAIPGVTRVTPTEALEADTHAFELLADRDVRAEVFRFAVHQGLTLVELLRGRSTLEEVFRRLTAGAPPNYPASPA